MALKRPGFRLTKPSDVRRLVARIANQFDQGQITETHARVLGYLANIALRAVESSTLARQMDRIEKKIGGKP